MRMLDAPCWMPVGGGRRTGLLWSPKGARWDSPGQRPGNGRAPTPPEPCKGDIACSPRPPIPPLQGWSHRHVGFPGRCPVRLRSGVRRLDAALASRGAGAVATSLWLVEGDLDKPEARRYGQARPPCGATRRRLERLRSDWGAILSDSRKKVRSTEVSGGWHLTCRVARESGRVAPEGRATGCSK